MYQGQRSSEVNLGRKFKICIGPYIFFEQLKSNYKKKNCFVDATCEPLTW